MSISLVIVTILILLVMFGAGQRILDNMRLNDKEALVILIFICIGLIIPPVWIGKNFCFSIGGFLIPMAIAIYLLFSCGWSRDLLRAFLGTIFVGGAVYLLQWLLPADPESVFIDNMYIYGIVAGIVSYMLGRSRRNAFVSCIFGLTLVDFVVWICNKSNGIDEVLGFGVGGAFNTYIVAIIISVAICEFLGRCFESAKKGDKKEQKEYNYMTHTYDSVKNGKLGNDNKKVDRLKQIANEKNANYNKNNLKNTIKQQKNGEKL